MPLFKKEDQNVGKLKALLVHTKAENNFLKQKLGQSKLLKEKLSESKLLHDKLKSETQLLKVQLEQTKRSNDNLKAKTDQLIKEKMVESKVKVPVKPTNEITLNVNGKVLKV